MPPAAARRREPASRRRLAGEHMQAHVGDAAQFLKALGNDQRLLILCSLLEGPRTVGELNEGLDLSQSALSQHLALLREAGLVSTRREAQTIHYSLPDGPVVRVLEVLYEIFCAPRSSRPPPRTGHGRCDD